MNKPLTEEELVAAAEEFAPKDFSPTTADEVDWVLGKIADARAKAARIRENAEKIARDAEREASFFEWKYGALLMEFVKQQIAAEGGKRKSIRLFNGSLGWRTTPARMVLADGEAAEARAIAWAKQHMPEAVCQVEKLDRMLLKEQVAEHGDAVVAVSTGECLDWATVVPAEERFFIK
ncbi:MAG: host-nuclease inhibitor Gam family protein [Janthinobacterium lividum]